MRRDIALHFGFGAILLLIAAVGAFTLVMSANTRDATRTVVFESEREAFLIGHVGQELSRERAATLEAVVDADAATRLRPMLATLEKSIDSDEAALAPLLSGTESASWRTLEPSIAALRHDNAEALRAAGRGDVAEVQRLLAFGNEQQETVAISLQRFSEVAHEDTTASLDLADRRMRSTTNIRSGALLVLLGATVVIWRRVWRTVKEQRSAIEQHLGRVENANRDLEAFAGRVAHDLKNLLAPIGLSVTLLRKDESKRDLADRIERSLRRAVDLLEGLLAFARAGAPAHTGERASVAEELDGVREDLAVVAERVNAALTLDVDPSLEVACSPALLHVALLNLAGNALKFLDGRPERRVRISAGRVGAACRIDVDDTGPGIAPELRQQIFEPFFRAPGVTAGGAGIGLATVRRVVDAYGGDVSVESVEGGTRFRVTLPLAPALPQA